MPVIDFHCYAFPGQSRSERVDSWRDRLRTWSRPWSRFMHQSQPLLRWLPNGMQRVVEEITAPLPVAQLLWESTPEDLRQAMDASAVDRAVVVAHPPLLTNEQAWDLTQAEPSRWIPAIFVSAQDPNATAELERWNQKGVRLLKLNPALDGVEPDSTAYRDILTVARDRQMVVMVHTGDFHSHLILRKPEYGRAEGLSPWFADFPSVPFVLAHMNRHEPEIAIDLAENHSNLWLSTSWQPEEVIAEAVRRIGAERVLFASDWPLVGDNMEVMLERLESCVRGQWITEQDRALILGENAERLLRWPAN